MEALRRAAVLSNRYPEDAAAGAAPAADADHPRAGPAGALDAPLRAWRAVVAEFGAARLGLPARRPVPQAIAHAALGTSMAAFTRWVENPGEDLERCLDDAFRELADGFATDPGRN